MDKWIRWLVVIFIFQLSATIFSQLDFEARAEAGLPLLELKEGQQVDAIEIAAGDGKMLSIKKINQGWVIPQFNNLPADKSIVDGLVEELLSAKRNWPVATTKNAARRFSVDEEEYKRKLTLKNGDLKLTELYLGTSPSFRKLHTRVVGDNNIYALHITTYHASVDVSDWIDKKLLQIGKGLTEIKGRDFVLSKTDRHWNVSLLDGEEETEQKKIAVFIGKISDIRASRLLGVDELSEIEHRQPDSIYTLLDGEKQITISLYQLENKSVVKSSLFNYYFEIPKRNLKELLDIDRKHFVTAKTKTSP